MFNIKWKVLYLIIILLLNILNLIPLLSYSQDENSENKKAQTSDLSKVKDDKKKNKDGFVEKCKCKNSDEYSEECCKNKKNDKKNEKKSNKKNDKKKIDEPDGCIDSCCTSFANNIIEDENILEEEDSSKKSKKYRNKKKNPEDSDTLVEMFSVFAAIGTVFCLYFSSTVLIPHLQEAIPLYYELDRGVFFGTEFLLFGHYMYNPNDDDKYGYLESGYGAGAGLQLTLYLGQMFSLDYNINYRYSTLTITKYIESRYYNEHKLHTVSHYLGFKYSVIGLYLNYNMHFSDLIQNELNHNFGIAYELLFPLISKTGTNLSFFFKHTITFRREDDDFLHRFVSPHFFDAGIKIKFGI